MKGLAQDLGHKMVMIDGNCIGLGVQAYGNGYRWEKKEWQCNIVLASPLADSNGILVYVFTWRMVFSGFCRPFSQLRLRFGLIQSFCELLAFSNAL